MVRPSVQAVRRPTERASLAVKSSCNTLLEHVRLRDSTQGVLQDRMIGAGEDGLLEPRPREIGLLQHGTGEMTLAQVGAREHRLHYCLREHSKLGLQVNQRSKVWTRLWRGPSARWRDSGQKGVYLGWGVLYSSSDCEHEEPGFQLQEGCGAVPRFDRVGGILCFRSGCACRCADRAGTCSGRSPRTRPDPRHPPLQPDHSRELRTLS